MNNVVSLKYKLTLNEIEKRPLKVNASKQNFTLSALKNQKRFSWTGQV